MGSPNEWWRAFFSGLWLEAQKQGAQATDNEAEARCLYDMLGLQQDSRVLDVPCGEGRHALPLAQSGCQLTGLDITEELLDLARSRAKEIGVDITWYHGGMKDLPWQQEFDFLEEFSSGLHSSPHSPTRVRLQRSCWGRVRGGFVYKLGEELIEIQSSTA